MKRERFVSVKEIINMVKLRGGDIAEHTSEDDIILYVIELIGVVGIPALFEHKVENLEIKKHKALLPCDFVEELGVKCCDKHFNASTDMFDIKDNKTNFPSYKIQGNYLVTSVEDGNVQLSYKSIKVDDDGYPMIIDDKSFIRALVSYIIYNLIYTDYINGRINENVMERIERDYEFNIAQASQRLTQPSMDEFENIARMMNSFIFRRNSRKNDFSDIGDEMIEFHRKSDVANFGFISPSNI